MPPSNANPLLLGTSDFDEIIEKDALFIDKSLFIKEFMNDGSKVVAILRPRRFGKSTNLSMLKSFLSMNAQSKSFDRYLIGKETHVVEKHCGKYPVVMLDLKDCKGDSWAQMFESAWLCLCKMVLLHEEELAGAIEAISGKMDFTKMTFTASEVFVASTLEWLTRKLHKKYGRRVVVLVDEYDAPLNHAFRQGYYKEASEFFGRLYSSALKGNVALEKACLVGIVEVRGAGILSGLNNIQVYSVAHEQYSAFFGFSMHEIGSLVSDELTKDTVKKWYNGYWIGNNLLINPWSFMSWYLRKSFDNYWAQSAYTETIDTILKPHLKNSLMEIFALLYNLEQVEVSKLSSQVNYSNQNWSIDGIIHFLIHTGYLTYRAIVDDPSRSGVAWIPNEEVRGIWESSIKNLLHEEFVPQFRPRIEGIFTANPPNMSDLQKVMQEMLMFCSSHDLTKQYENSGHIFYFGAFLSILHDGQKITVTSNLESGHGRHDIRIRILALKRAFIFEFKRSQRESDLQEDAQTGLEQIIDRNYVADLRDCECFLVGVAFFGKKLSEFAFKKVQV